MPKKKPPLKPNTIVIKTDLMSKKARHRFVHLTQGNGAGISASGARANAESAVSMTQGGKHHEECTTCRNTQFCNNYVQTTKYNILTFLPVNLFEQFQKKANFYFLICAIISLTPLSPKTAVVSVSPLVFVLMVSATKEAVEDYNRYKMDKEVNETLVEAYRDGSFVNTQWQNVKVGDMVRVLNNQSFPADLIVLQSSENEGSCSIETMNLDGETNLKVKKAPRECYTLECENKDGSDFPERLSDCVIESSGPNAKLDFNSWTGALTFNKQSEAVPLNMGNMLLRGCTLRNTKWIVGCVMFTGAQSKLCLNSNKGKFKRSNVDLIVDRALYVLFTIQFILCTFGFLMNYFWMNANVFDKFYLPHYHDDSTSGDLFNEAGLTWFTYLVLLDILIPISLYVSIEMVKFGQSFLINWDMDMYDESTDTPAHARTSNLNEELGQVNYIFSDKTGTLTQNKMNFVSCSVGGVLYGEHTDTTVDTGKLDTARAALPKLDGAQPFEDASLFNDLLDSKESHTLDMFLTSLAVNHSVQASFPECEKEHIHSHPECQEKVSYQASSPDEKALVLAAKSNCYYFYHSEPKEVKVGDTTLSSASLIHVNIRGKTQVFELLDMFEFNSTRARMSVIVRDPRNGKIILFCKGSDTALLPLFSEQGKQHWATTNKHLSHFGHQGLRTLVLAYKEVSEQDFLTWMKTHQECKASIDGRAEKVEASQTAMDSGLTLIGATAIEDKLQDGVPETIAGLAQADIKIWMLTGDKVETAINIGKSCRLITPGMTQTGLFKLVADEELKDAEAAELTMKLLDDAYTTVKHQDRINPPERAVVVNGRALGFIFNQTGAGKKKALKLMSPEEVKRDDEIRGKFLELLQSCKAVICCRVSPSQKAEVVLLVKSRVPGAVTLAIGDGANDVSMIKQAHVGIGISGLEGLQAVMSADYSIAQFRFLRRLMMVHGAWSYQRTSLLILYSFYKNIAIAMTQIWFAFDSGFSAQMFYDAYCGSVYNMFFTSFPIMFAAMLNQDVSAKNTLKFPALFTSGHRNEFFSLKLLGYTIVEATMISIVLYYCSQYIWSSPGADGRAEDLWVASTFMYCTLVLVVNIRVLLDTYTITYYNAFIIALSVAVWFIWCYFYQWLAWTPDFHGIPTRIYSQDRFWPAYIIVTLICCMPQVAGRYIRRTYYYSNRDIVQEIDRGYNPVEPLSHGEVVKERSMSN